jgi:hypothetical protein
MSEAEEEIPTPTDQPITMMSEVEAEILPVGHVDSSPDVEFTMAEAEEEVLSVEYEATPTDQPTTLIIEAEAEILPVGHADITPDVELVSYLHEAQAREKSSELMWNQEVWRNQRAAEACGGPIIHMGVAFVNNA